MDAPVVFNSPAPVPTPVNRSRPLDPRLALARLRDREEPVRVPAALDRGQILDATDACLRESGYDGATIRRIAARLDCAVGTIYRYFSDKRALLDAVTQRRFEPVARQIEAGAPVRYTAELYARTAAAEPQQYRLMFWLASVGQPREARSVPAVTERILAGWAGQLGSSQAAQRFWSQLHGALMLGLTPDVAVPPVPGAPERVKPTETEAPAVTRSEPTFAADEREDVTLL